MVWMLMFCIHTLSIPMYGTSYWNAKHREQQIRVSVLYLEEGLWMKTKWHPASLFSADWLWRINFSRFLVISVMHIIFICKVLKTQGMQSYRSCTGIKSIHYNMVINAEPSASGAMAPHSWLSFEHAILCPQLRVCVTNEEGNQVLAQALTLTYKSLKPWIWTCILSLIYKF